MRKKIILLIMALTMAFSLTACGYNEISKKLVADAVVIADDKLSFVVDSTGDVKVFDVDYTNFKDSCESVKKKYDYEPFLSHTKEIIVSTDIKFSQLKKYISELKGYYQISPDMRIFLADDDVITAIMRGKINTDEVEKTLKNCDECDERLCHYDNLYKDNEFAVLHMGDNCIVVEYMNI
ncbi:MAG: hypothetical protein IJV39_04355 [Ruminococcus sp.]|nr:hypothetical protein [Ruminococcus sp.]